MISSAPEARNDRLIPVALLCSVALHGIFILVYLYSLTSTRPLSTQVNLYNVELIQSPPRSEKKQQIVETQSNQQPPKEPARFEAEKDNQVIKEQIRRGEDAPPAGSKQASAPAPKAEKPASQQETKRSAPSKLNLKLDNMQLGDVAEKPKEKEDPGQKNIQQALSNSAPLGAGVDVSRLGSRDFLPDIPDGEVTLLNAKANKFAVFVRRVASQVFANLKASGWQSLSVGDINNIDKEARFEAVLNRQGQLVSVSKLAQSGSSKFDTVLESSIRKGAKDPNPPAGAEASDGMIHFTFEARSWVEMRSSPRTGAPVQRRWLLLGTGLD